MKTISILILLIILIGCTTDINNVCILDDSSKWKVSDSTSNGSPFGSAWNKNNVQIDDCKLSFFINDTPLSGKPFSSGEIKSKVLIQDGKFEVNIKPPKVSGVITGFFLFSDNTDSANHHEIDFEFVGTKTDSVQINYIFNGVRGKEKFIYLGFDASLDFHRYSIVWSKDSVVWYADEKKIFAISSTCVSIPSTPMKVFFNLWCVDDSDATYWSGKFTYPNKPVYAFFENYEMKNVNSVSKIQKQKIGK